jgi:hypothetical protein
MCDDVFILDHLPTACPECRRRRAVRAFVAVNPLGTVTTACPLCGSWGGGEDVPGGPDLLAVRYVQRARRVA